MKYRWPIGQPCGPGRRRSSRIRIPAADPELVDDTPVRGASTRGFVRDLRIREREPRILSSTGRPRALGSDVRHSPVP